MMRRETLNQTQSCLLRWQAAMLGLTITAIALLLLVFFGLPIDNLKTSTPAEALRAMQVQHQRLVCSIGAVFSAVGGCGIYAFKIRRRAA
jgi:Na+/H+-translocating membrane pyrophosphatase